MRWKEKQKGRENTGLFSLLLSLSAAGGAKPGLWLSTSTGSSLPVAKFLGGYGCLGSLLEPRASSPVQVPVISDGRNQGWAREQRARTPGFMAGMDGSFPLTERDHVSDGGVYTICPSPILLSW